jgi:hypothetical protein
MKVYGVVDTRLGEAVELFIRPEDAERVVGTGIAPSPTTPACSGWSSSNLTRPRTSPERAATHAGPARLISQGTQESVRASWQGISRGLDELDVHALRGCAGT